MIKKSTTLSSFGGNTEPGMAGSYTQDIRMVKENGPKA
jgi:hypothetical protein